MRGPRRGFDSRMWAYKGDLEGRDGLLQLRLEGSSFIWPVVVDQVLDTAVNEAEKVPALRECLHASRRHRQAIIRGRNQEVSQNAKKERK